MSTAASILTGQEYRMTNVLSFRKKMTQAELTKEVQRVNKFVEDGGFKRSASTATATFSAEPQGQEQLMDFELLVPLDKPFSPPDGCVCKPEIYITNAVTIRHIGSPANLQATYEKLGEYLDQHGLQPITACYNVTVKEAKTPAEADSMIVDIYVGVNPNIL